MKRLYIIEKKPVSIVKLIVTFKFFLRRKLVQSLNKSPAFQAGSH